MGIIAWLAFAGSMLFVIGTACLAFVALSIIQRD